jgi:hypothetical protein
LEGPDTRRPRVVSAGPGGVLGGLVPGLVAWLSLLATVKV